MNNQTITEKDLMAYFTDAYETHFGRIHCEQSYLNVLMHYIGELGELSQCYRKGRGEETTRGAKVFLKNYAHPQVFTDSDQKEYVEYYKQIVSGSVGDELADCVLVAGVLLMRLNKEKGFEVFKFEKIAFRYISKMEYNEFDGLICWAIESAVSSFDTILEAIEKDEDYMAMTKVRTLANNAIHIANELKIDLNLHIQGKLIYNKLRKN